jgi:hypothetical protein
MDNPIFDKFTDTNKGSIDDIKYKSTSGISNDKFDYTKSRTERNLFLLKKYKWYIIVIIAVVVVIVIIILIIFVFPPSHESSSDTSLKHNTKLYNNSKIIDAQTINFNKKSANKDEINSRVDNSVIVTRPNNVLSDVEISTKQTNTASQSNMHMQTKIESKSGMQQSELNDLDTSLNVKTKKFTEIVNTKIDTDPTSTFSMNYKNIGPSLKFNNFYYGTLDKSCGNEINLNELVKYDRNQQTLYITGKDLNGMIGNKCQENRYLFLTGEVEGEKFL